MSSISESTERSSRCGILAAALMPIVLLLGIDGRFQALASAQTPPGYTELFEDPPRTDQLTQADLPNLGRLVVLEATSMFVHARSDLYGSPECTSCWPISTRSGAADAFVAAVSGNPSQAQEIEAGRLVFPDLASGL